jgi:hypothetical protein
MTGIVLGGGRVSGVDVSNTTAVETDVKKGVIFFKSDGSQVVGAMPEQAGTIVMPTTFDQTFVGGKLLTGDLVVKGDANLVASKIKVGTNIFGVTGTFTNDANATADKILSGYSAYVKGVKINGSLATPRFYFYEDNPYSPDYINLSGSITVAAGFKVLGITLNAKGADIVDSESIISAYRLKSTPITTSDYLSGQWLEAENQVDWHSSVVDIDTLTVSGTTLTYAFSVYFGFFKFARGSVYYQIQFLGYV